MSVRETFPALARVAFIDLLHADPVGLRAFACLVRRNRCVLTTVAHQPVTV